MKNMKNMTRFILIVFLLFGWGCSKRAQSLSVSINPGQPTLITASSTATGGTGSTVQPTAPYFSINSLILTWSGNQPFQFIALSLFAGNVSSTTTTTSGTTPTPFTCGGSGAAINVIFTNSSAVDCNGTTVQSSVLDTNGNVTINAAAPNCPITVTSSGFFCDSLPITVNPDPNATYNINTEVVVYGEGLDSSGNATGRINGTTFITVQ